MTADTLDSIAAAHLAALDAGEPHALAALERLHLDLLAVADEQRRTLAVLHVEDEEAERWDGMA